MNNQNHKTLDDVPDEWILVGDFGSEPGANIDGATFIDPNRTVGVNIINYHANSPNEIVFLFDGEVHDLLHELLDYLSS
jgi:hypothetical protein